MNPGPSLTPSSVTFFLPGPDQPNAPTTGPGSFVISNAGPSKAYSKKSNAVSVPIGARISIASVSQGGALDRTITVNGTGFSPLTVINFFNAQAGGALNLGGIKSGGLPKIPLTMINDTQFTFSVPAGGVS